MEVLRACVQSRTVAPQVQLMSFNTHNLTQLTFGFSREDSPEEVWYVNHKMFPLGLLV